MILPLYYYDHPILRKKAVPIAEFTDEILQLAQDLIESVVHYPACGLAAPQVGKLLRIFVIRDEWIAPDGVYHLGEPEVFINPVLSKPSREGAIMSEGCLSLPGLHVDVPRPSSIWVRYQQLDGKIVEEEAKNFRARVIMHENDHLNGVLHIDRTDPAQRKKFDPQLRAIKTKYSSPSQ